jgi:hypothetical protein
MILTQKAMENTMILLQSGIVTDEKLRSRLFTAKNPTERTLNSPVMENLVAEGGENFFHYLKDMDLEDESNIMVLSSRHGYYYDYKDLKGVSILVNLKKLNRMRHLDSFLHIVYDSLSAGSNFIGCFSDSRTNNSLRQTAKSCKGFGNYLDSGTNIEIDKIDVFTLLELHGFKVIDMTVINGLTYFKAQKRTVLRLTNLV